LALKACPYRREHEWEWEPQRQLWECRNCFTLTVSRLDHMAITQPMEAPELDAPSFSEHAQDIP
jgi:hypothetical protein